MKRIKIFISKFFIPDFATTCPNCGSDMIAKNTIFHGIAGTCPNCGNKLLPSNYVKVD